MGDLTKDTASNKKVHLYWLDSIRFLAALVVVVSHFRGAFFVEFGLLNTDDKSIFTSLFFFITRLGHEAVLIFFVLSGYLVGGKLIERLVNKEFNVRILLPLISALLYILLVHWIIGIPISYLDFLGNLFSLQGIYVESISDPFWSLPYEVWSYVFWGCMTYYLLTADKLKTRNRLFIVLILSVCVLIFSKLNFIYLAVWGMGALSFFRFFKRKNIKVLIACILGMLVTLAALQLNKQTVSMETGVFQFVEKGLLELLFALCSCVVIQQVVLFKPNSRFLQIDKVGTKFANFSYTLYLTHFPTIKLLQYLGFTKSAEISIMSIYSFTLATVISILIAYLIYFFFEKRTNTVKSKIKAYLLS